MAKRSFSICWSENLPPSCSKDNTKVHKSIVTWKGKRIIYAEEGTKKTLDYSLIKKIGNGISIEIEIMYGCIEIVNVFFKMFVAITNRNLTKTIRLFSINTTKVQLFSHFGVNREFENVENVEVIGDPLLGDTLATEQYHKILIVHYAMKYDTEGILALLLEFTLGSKETMKENNKFAKWFEENFEIAEVTISLDRVLECSYSSAVNMERKELIKFLKGL